MAPPLRSFTLTLFINTVLSLTFSSKLVHRFSHEAKAAIRVSKWPELNSVEYYRVLYDSDVQRQRQHKLLLPFGGSSATNFGDDFAWLYYTWIHIGTPNVPFLVALDTGSDLLWVPCECELCAPLSASHYHNLDGYLNEYHPSMSSTSKHLTCSHHLCESDLSCHSSKDPCAYSVRYLSDNTSTSGKLVEDILHLASGREDASNTSVNVPVIIGCGMKQTGGYLDGAAPDGVLGLGLGEISVPSSLAKLELIPNTFSLCFNKDFSGRIYFGDQGPAAQQSTSFSPLDGKYKTYIVGVETSCIGKSCLEKTNFRVLMDSGSSFTFIPNEVYNQITQEFDRHVDATRDTSKENPFDYCYRTSSNEPKFPALAFVFSPNNSFVVQQPVMIFNGKQGVIGFCLALQPTDSDIGIIGQNYMTGYHMVFDRENLKLSWSESNCENLSDDGKKMHLAPKSAPTNHSRATEQERAPSEDAVAPAIAGRAPADQSAAKPLIVLSQYSLQLLPFLFLSLYSIVLELGVETWTL